MSQLTRYQYKAISHAKGTRWLIPYLRLVREMKRERIKPDFVIYNSLLACIAEEDLPLEAWAVIGDMLAMGISPDRQSYHHILRVGVTFLTGILYDLMSSRPYDGHLSSSWEALEKMTEQGFPPNEQTYTLIVKRIAAAEGIEPALQVMHEMAKRGFPLDLPTATQDVIKLAADLHFPRLAIDLARNFETHSVRRIDGKTWMACLVSSAELLYYVSHLLLWYFVAKLSGSSPSISASDQVST